ncbi:hypothetical protein [Streptomyces sp. JW3]|uniref:hypothetical protein n=1 Tax=Streptomyces sp. JW3 TaxID=3456955 RepID=UPI003FA40C2E
MAESPSGSRPPSPAARRRAWARVLVLLLALLVPGTYAQAQAGPPAAVTGDTGGGTAAEYDLLDSALRAPARATRRGAAPRRPAPRPPRTPRPTASPAARCAAPALPPPSFRHPARSVVLRC